jgi:outer membrane protein assembly factor BamB
MKDYRNITVTLLVLFAGSLCLGQAYVDSEVSFVHDWPQFRGPNGDGKSRETNLLQEWPAEGPELLWSAKGVGDGFSSISVVDGWVYTAGMVGKDMIGYVFAINPQGQIVWEEPYGPEWKKSHPSSHTTPTIDGDRLYIMSSYGLIACYDRNTGEQIWKVDTQKVYGAQDPKWGIAESVMIYGDMAICTPGGTKATMIAFNKFTGEVIWKNLVTRTQVVESVKKEIGQKSSYCTPTLIQANGQELIITNIQKSIILVEPKTGTVVCNIPHEKRHDLAAVNPVYWNNHVYVTTGYTRHDQPSRGYMFALSDDLKSSTLKWNDRNLDCHHGGIILLDDCVHGSTSAIYPPFSKEKPLGRWICLDLSTGTIKYISKLVGKGSVIYGDGMLYCYGENGKVALVKPKADGYEMVSSFDITQGEAEHWAHPAISNGTLYIRHGSVVMAFDIRQK